MTAVYRAWALATAGRDVVLVTRLHLLHQYLAQLAPDLTENLVVTTYERWVRDFWRVHFQADPPRPDEDDRSYDWTEMQRSCILDGVRATTHLVIDEGQNLPFGFYQLCHVLGASVTVFADENQRIGDEQTTLSEMQRTLDSRSEPLVLPENYRNTGEIARLAAAFRVEAREEFPLPARVGRPPVVMRIPSFDHLVNGVSHYFNAHRDWTIGIICRSTFLVRDIQSRLTKVGLNDQTQAYVHNDVHRRTVDFSTRPIKVVSTASMKGLEFDSVFVPDLDAYAEDPTGVEARLRFLVLCTRAREDLHLAHRGPQEPAILSSVPDSLLTRHRG
ncbi:hypothetical protein [Streptomyces virginiae]|uniref:hypothetical protein n=1 Tax=Streptomyces TaxID=1883 RepID=UPI00177DA2AB|nr:hypothetical protein [Streptomyces virginiae]MBP2346148.1 DNA helicase IV [Streptomyces virginiae]